MVVEPAWHGRILPVAPQKEAPVLLPLLLLLLLLLLRAPRARAECVAAALSSHKLRHAIGCQVQQREAEHVRHV